MRIRWGALLPTAITIGFGFLVLIGLLVGDGLGTASTLVRDSGLRQFADLSLQIVAITLSLMVLVGVVNLLVVHFRRIAGRKRGYLFSAVTIASFALAVAAHTLQRADLQQLLLEQVQVPVESALAGLLLFSLVYGAATVMRRQLNWSGLLFVLVVVIMLGLSIPFGIEAVTQVRAWIMEVPVSAGARGILLGIALATVVAGMRVLIGQDRSYRE
ncbi:MAG TPA: hypothetical protein PKX07_13385 [Aggregatilineales bacterium]|jgi:hypothetical protein|nr:hypothetical protein [Aggregatilineales bacterium]